MTDNPLRWAAAENYRSELKHHAAKNKKQFKQQQQSKGQTGFPPAYQEYGIYLYEFVEKHENCNILNNMYVDTELGEASS